MCSCGCSLLPNVFGAYIYIPRFYMKTSGFQAHPTFSKVFVGQGIYVYITNQEKRYQPTNRWLISSQDQGHSWVFLKIRICFNWMIFHKSFLCPGSQRPFKQRCFLLDKITQMLRIYGIFTYMKGEKWLHSRRGNGLVNIPFPWNIWVMVVRLFQPLKNGGLTSRVWLQPGKNLKKNVVWMTNSQ